ncbi:MAG: ATP-binding protein [Methanomassiliicoccus sp.]|nr:ATP-binding protein [Methanomassiliicoccus sp.]
MVGIMGLLEEKKARRYVQLSNERGNTEAWYRSLYENLDEGFIVLEVIRDERGEPVDAVILDANPSWEKTVGHDLQVEGGKWTRSLMDRIDPMLLTTLGRVEATGLKEVHEGRVQDSEMILETQVFRLGPGRVGVLVREVTERKWAEEVLTEIEASRRTSEALGAERQRLYDVLEGLPVMVSLITRDHRILFANRAFRERFGDYHGRPCYECRYGQSRPCTFCESFRVFETGKPHYWEVQAPDGSIIEAYDFPFTDVDGWPMVLEMDLDVTEKRQAEDMLKKAADELRRSNAELQQFAYVASHDLREPLRMVISHLELLEKKYDGRVMDEKAKEYLHYAIEGADRMRRMIADLLLYSRIDIQERTEEQVDMDGVLAAVLGDLKNYIEESGATVTSDPLPPVEADRMQMLQLLENLVVNAIKFRGQEAPRVHLSANQRDSEWVFSVRDNGIGIDPHMQDEVFHMFHRLHNDNEYEGTGIGLAISKKIVERHGGRIWFESEPGKGTTFLFSLPVVQRGPG